MKSNVVVVWSVFLCMMLNSLVAQAEGIRFEDDKNWKEIVEKARKTGKLIFVDCYTSWCGPCKVLSEKVFVNKAVGEWFNARFVNVKYDMEKDADGVVLQKKYRVTSYPTLLFIDPESGQVVHKVVGFKDVEALLIEARTACDPESGLGMLSKRYEAGERDTLFLRKYIVALQKAAQRRTLIEVVPVYLELLSDQQLVTSWGWNLLNQFITDPLSPPFCFLISHDKQYYPIAGQEFVEFKLKNTINNAVVNLFQQDSMPVNESRVNGMVAYLLSIDHPVVSAALARIYALKALAKGDYAELLQVMQEAFKYNVFRGVEGKQFFRVNMKHMLSCKNLEVLKKAIAWIEKRCGQEKNEFEKRNLEKLKEELVRLF